MASIADTVDLAAPERVDAAARTAAQLNTLEELLAHARSGGGERSVARHRARGKLTARERVELLVDPGAALLELSPLAAHGMYGGDVPAGGIVTAIAPVEGRLCVIVANDATVKGGTYFPVSARKHLRAQEIALDNRLPCIYLADSGGAHLPLQSEMFADRDHGGRMFYNQARMSELGIPQVACVMGSCTAGGAYVPAMCDEAVIVRGTGTIFLGGPPLVKAATGEDVTAEELGGADVHTRLSGVADHMALDDRHALAIVREIIAATALPVAPAPAGDGDRVIPPPAGARGELAALADQGVGPLVDPRAIIARVFDGGQLHEFKARYGTSLVCGFAALGGRNVGVVATHGMLDGDACRKGAHLVELCRARKLPMVFLVNTRAAPGAGHDPLDHRARARHLAPLASVVACANVPIVTVVTGEACGPDAFALPLRPMQPRLLWLWPGARLAIDSHAVDPLGALDSTARVFDDGVIDPASTREVLRLSLAAATATSSPGSGVGVLRM